MSAMVLGKEMAFKKMQRKMLSAAWSIVRFVLIAGIGYSLPADHEILHVFYVHGRFVGCNRPSDSPAFYH